MQGFPKANRSIKSVASVNCLNKTDILLSYTIPYPSSTHSDPSGNNVSVASTVTDPNDTGVTERCGRRRQDEREKDGARGRGSRPENLLGLSVESVRSTFHTFQSRRDQGGFLGKISPNSCQHSTAHLHQQNATAPFTLAFLHLCSVFQLYHADIFQLHGISRVTWRKCVHAFLLISLIETVLLNDVARYGEGDNLF